MAFRLFEEGKYLESLEICRAAGEQAGTLEHGHAEGNQQRAYQNGQRVFQPAMAQRVVSRRWRQSRSSSGHIGISIAMQQFHHFTNTANIHN